MTGVTSMKSAAVVVALPKTDTLWETLRNAIRSIAYDEPYKLPGTIEDASVIDGIEEAIDGIGYGAART